MPALISYRNLADAATLTAGIGTAVAAFPLSNMQNRQLRKVGGIKRPAASVTARLDVDLGSIQAVKVLALLNCNYTVGGSSGPFPNADITVNTSTDNITWSSGMTFAGMHNDPGGIAMGLPPAVFAVLNSSVRYFRITYGWPIAASAGNVATVGRLWIGDAISVPSGVDQSWELDAADTGSIDDSAGSEWYEDRRTRTRVLRIGLAGKDLKSSLVFGFDPDSTGVTSDIPTFNGLQLEAGCTSDVIVLPRASSDLWNRRLGIYGHIDSGGRPSIKKLAGDYYSVGMTVIEER